MSWIDEEIESIKEQNDRKEAAREWSLRKSEILKGQVFQIWSAVSGQIKKDVAALGNVAKGEVEFIEVPTRTFTVKKISRPTVDVTTSIRPDGRTIDIKIRQTYNPLGVTEEKDDAIGINMDENENIHYFYFTASFDSLEDVSRIILAPILKAFRR